MSDIRLLSNRAGRAAPRGGRASARAAFALSLAAALIGFGLALRHALAAHGLDVTRVGEIDVERFVSAWGVWSGAISVGLMVLHSFLPLPAEIIALANGMLFGPCSGVTLTWIGAMLGAALSFGLARGLGRPFVRVVLGESRSQRIEDVTLTPAALLVMRLVPLISFNLINYAAGVMGVRWFTFLWTTAIGILPLTIALVLASRAVVNAPLWLWLGLGAALISLWFFFERRISSDASIDRVLRLLAWMRSSVIRRRLPGTSTGLPCQ